MAERTFIVRFRPPGLEPQLFTAERAEIQEDHLVLLTSTGTLAAMFLMEIVESWSEGDFGWLPRRKMSERL
jgi:hypothetical protein